MTGAARFPVAACRALSLLAMWLVLENVVVSVRDDFVSNVKNVMMLDAVVYHTNPKSSSESSL